MEMACSGLEIGTGGTATSADKLEKVGSDGRARVLQLGEIFTSKM